MFLPLWYNLCVVKPEKLLEALEIIESSSRSVRVAACEDNFPLFFVYYYARYIKYGFAPFHYEMFDDVDDLIKGKIRELAWIMFRESAKTSIAKAFVVWCIVYKKKNYINYDSYDKGNAESALFDIVTEMTSNRRLIADFGELYSKQQTDKPQLKRISNFITNNGIKVEAFSTQESARGRIYGADRPGLVIVDDFENSKTKESEIVTQKVIEHIDEFKKALDSKDGRVLYLGNFITDTGSVNHIIRKSKANPNIRVRSVPVMTDYEITDMKIVKATPTWPSKYCISKADAKRDKKISLQQMLEEDTSPVFFPEMLNEPRNEQDREFKRTWFRYRDMTDVILLDTRRFMTIDPRGKDDKEGKDFIGVTIAFVDKENNRYLKSWHGKWAGAELANLIFQLYGQFYFEKIGIESTAFTEGFKPYLKGEMEKRGIYLPMAELKHGGVNKNTRVRGLIPYYESGKIWHITENSHNTCEDLEHELLAFPNGVNDDIIDSAAYQLQIAKAPEPIEDEVAGIYTADYV